MDGDFLSFLFAAACGIGGLLLGMGRRLSQIEEQRQKIHKLESAIEDVTDELAAFKLQVASEVPTREELNGAIGRFRVIAENIKNDLRDLERRIDDRLSPLAGGVEKILHKLDVMKGSDK